MKHYALISDPLLNQYGSDTVREKVTHIAHTCTEALIHNDTFDRPLLLAYQLFEFVKRRIRQYGIETEV